MLTVEINSFSYKKGLPEDLSGNGGGYIFDCRGIENPGRYDLYKKQTGRDEPVKDFLIKKTEMPNFLHHVFQVLKITLDNYISRNFSYLQVSFGCTGGQHRSVFAADAFAEWLMENYPNELQIKLNHREQEVKKWINE